jgi:hypothetical protein
MIKLPVANNSPYAGKKVVMLPRVAGEVLRRIPAWTTQCRGLAVPFHTALSVQTLKERVRLREIDCMAVLWSETRHTSGKTQVPRTARCSTRLRSVSGRTEKQHRSGNGKALKQSCELL